mmetsp:Transcript_12474/g.14495  ORF Transcript_12474/g.14495 Transcript_12474/m.14495 type:complete len:232 (-) Transcript_12474:191-886(-)
MAVDGSNSGLATYLGLSNDDWKNTMIFCGLARLHGKELRIERKQWNMLLCSAELSTIILDRTQVGKATDIVGLQKRHYWIHLGNETDGIMNYILKRFLCWVDIRVEQIPDEELTARDIWLDSVTDMHDRNEEVKTWDILNQLELLSMKEEKKILVEQVKGWRGQKATTDEEKRRRKNVKDTKKTLNAKIKNMLTERKVLNSAYLTSFHLEAICRKVYNKEYKKRKTHKKDI